MKIAINAERWQGDPYGEIYAVNREIASIVQRKLKIMGVKTMRVDDDGKRRISDSAKIISAVANRANLLLTIACYQSHGYDNVCNFSGFALMTKKEPAYPTFDGFYEQALSMETPIADRIESKFLQAGLHPSTYNRVRDFIVSECVLCPSVKVCPEVGKLNTSESYLRRKHFIRKSADAIFEGIKEAVERGELHEWRCELYSRNSAS